MIKVSEAEYEVMRIIWEEKETTSSQVISKLSYKNWTNNTIRTLINRLVEKKAIGISKKIGKTYIYVPLIDEKNIKYMLPKNMLIKCIMVHMLILYWIL